MNQPSPRKRKPRSKLKKINVSSKQYWSVILKEIDKEHIPINLLLSMTVNLIDGTQVKIDIRELLNQGNDPDDLEDKIQSRIKTLDAIIKDIDFFIDVEAVADAVQPLTDEILKDL